MAPSNRIIAARDAGAIPPFDEEKMFGQLRWSFCMPHFNSPRYMTFKSLVFLSIREEIILPADIVDSMIDIAKHDKTPKLYRCVSSLFLYQIDISRQTIVFGRCFEIL